MATFTITDAKNFDELTTKAGADIYNINGGTLTIDSDTRYGLNTTTTTGPAATIAISDTLGGTLEVDARYVRLIPYDGGNAANAPAGGTIVSTGGGASGKLICFLSSLTAAPTAVGAATPASGFIKVKQWNSTAYADNEALSFTAGTVTCNVNGTDTVGWISLVNRETGTITGRRLGLLRFRGAMYQIGTTGGSRSDTYQLPTAGEAVYLPGVQVETSVGSGVYEWYPNAGNQTALVTTVGTEAVRGKVCWISSTGLLRFGHDGTNSTGGYLPVSGLNVQIPNVYMHSCTTTDHSINAVPNATLATRFEFVAAGAQIIMDTVTTSWYMLIAQAYSISLTDVGIATALSITELATATTLNRVCVGIVQAQSSIALTLSINLAGGTISNSVFARYTYSASADYAISGSYLADWTFDNVTMRLIANARGNANSGGSTITTSKNIIYNDCTTIGGKVYFGNTTDSEVNDLVYIDLPAGTTPNTMGQTCVTLGICSNFKIEGLSFGGLERVQPYNYLVDIGAFSNKIRIRNIGTIATPLNCGGTREDSAAWTRVTTTATVTKVAHGLKVNDVIMVVISSDVGAIVIGIKTVVATPTADTFTFACTNGGAASGSLSYYPCTVGNIVSGTTYCSDIKVQRVYCKYLRGGGWFLDNSNTNCTLESVRSEYIAAQVASALNSVFLNTWGNSIALTPQNQVYGTHWLDWFSCPETPNLSAQSWSRTTTTATVTSTDHNLRVGDTLVVTVTSDAAAIILGTKTVTNCPTKDTFTFTCLNAGAASGTLSFVVNDSDIALLANEPTAQTQDYVTVDVGNPSFTSSGTVYFPLIDDQMTWEMQRYVKCHTTFLPTEIVMGSGTLANHELTYAIDKNDGNGYSSFKNLSYRRITAGGSSASTTVTMADTTGVAVNDYVFGTNVAPLAKVVSIDSGTAITVSIANTGVVSGTLRFNQIPNEVISDVDAGFKLKIRMKAKANTSTFSYILIRMNTPEANRVYQYTLDYATVTMTGLVTGSRVKATKVSDGTVLFNGAESSGAITFQTDYIGAIYLEARKASSAPYYKPFVTQVTTVADETVSAVALQALD